jgi:hypothetical protein
MKELLRFTWDVLLFRHEAYAQHVTRTDILKRGLILLVSATLVAGFLSFARDLINDLRPMSIERQRQEAEEAIQQFNQSWRDMRQFTDVPPEVIEQINAYMRSSIEMGLRIEALPTRLPKPVGGVFEALGRLLSLPFSRMTRWIGYTIWVLLIAKLMGGRATAVQTLGATALYAVPHVLDILHVVPCLGGLLGLIATVWGIAIYVKALAVANEFSIGRSIVATVAPALIGGILAATGMLTLLILALLAG